MRRILFALSAAVVLAKNDNASNKDTASNKMAQIKRPMRVRGPNDVSSKGGNTCYANCPHPLAENGCEVIDKADGKMTSMGSFDCRSTSPCGYGETGEGGYICDLSGINDRRAEDTSASCGGKGFDIDLILGRIDCDKERGKVVCPSTCVCDSCDCNPCGENETCELKNGRWGGFLCKRSKVA
jgi:hypothetical protein